MRKYKSEDIKPKLKMTKKDKTRFWEKVEKSDECWEWKAGKTGGYGMYKLHGRMLRSHRVSWILAHNKDIPDGMMICHKCDNPSCVNPKHLFLGTAFTNRLDAIRKGRIIQRGENNANSKLNKDQVSTIKKHFAEAEFDYGDKKLFCKFWANKYGVVWETVAAVLRGDSWTHVNI